MSGYNLSADFATKKTMLSFTGRINILTITGDKLFIIE
jgi:hypothetical protein